jgi:hypothetical protein
MSLSVGQVFRIALSIPSAFYLTDFELHLLKMDSVS